MSQQKAHDDRIIGVAFLASIVGGLIAGIGARIIMRIIVLALHQPPGFTIAGTLNIVIMGLFLGLVVGPVIGILSVAIDHLPRGKKYLQNPFVRGITLGVLLIIIIIPLSSLNEDLSLA